MSPRLLLLSCCAAGALLASSISLAADCEADGDVRFLCGPVSPEDLAVVPDSPWLIASGMEDDGFLYLADTRDFSSSVLYPTANARPQHDTAMYGGCSGPDMSGFRPHGINLVREADGSQTLYVVRHGAREAIEVFIIDRAGTAPSLTWVGCVMAPESVVFNSVVGLPGGGIAATHMQLPSGAVWEWQPGQDWTEVPGSETAGPNGLEVSADGRWFYIGGWGTRSLIRLSRGQVQVQKQSVDVGHHIDNVRWAPDGTLFAAGHVGPEMSSIIQCMNQRQCDGVSSRVTRVDPETLSAQLIVNYPSNAHLILGTVAIQVDDEIWVGGIAGGDRIARFAAP
ncbi:MAG: hypothetical protein O2971_13575 [Proteobacteria bacterium]|nr:hypothetical protein [Pseudomonadota bacterium]